MTSSQNNSSVPACLQNTKHYPLVPGSTPRIIRPSCRGREYIRLDDQLAEIRHGGRHALAGVSRCPSTADIGLS